MIDLDVIAIGVLVRSGRELPAPWVRLGALSNLPGHLAGTVWLAPAGTEIPGGLEFTPWLSVGATHRIPAQPDRSTYEELCQDLDFERGEAAFLRGQLEELRQRLEDVVDLRRRLEFAENQLYVLRRVTR